jgi:kumamolisin
VRRNVRVPLLFSGFFAAAVALATGVVLLVEAGPWKPSCRRAPGCVVLPQAPAFLTGRLWRSSLGVRVEYYPETWSVEARDDRDLRLTAGNDQGQIVFRVRVAPVAERSPEQLLADLADTLPANVATDRSPADAIADPTIGSVDGVAAAYSGALDTPQGPGKPLQAFVLASQDGKVSTAVLIATTFPRDESSWESRWPILFYADQLLNIVRWPTQPAQPATDVRAATASSSAAKPADDLGPVPDRRQVVFSLVLRQRDTALTAYLARSRRGHLSAAEFGRRFGLSDAALARLRRSLQASGFRVLGGYPQRTLLRVAAPAKRVETVFQVALHDFRDADGRRFRAPTRVPKLPAQLASSVAGLSGLSTQPLVPADVPATRCGKLPSGRTYPCSGLSPTATARAYDISPLHTRGIRGQGQRVAIVSLGRFSERDVRLFDGRFRIHGPPVEHVPVGPKPAPLDPDVLGEVNLDIDNVRAVAPAAKILNYETPDYPGGIGEAVNRIVADGRARIASVSYVVPCDSPETFASVGGDRAAIEHALQAAVAHGITVFVASGDAAAYPCHRENIAKYGPSALYPSDSPYVVSVGATLLATRRDGTYLEESGWEYPTQRTGTGGGLNPIDPRPIWQDAPGVENASSNGKRQFPDVAAAGDSASGYLIVSGGYLFSGAGTSASAPFWAGAAALLSQYTGGGGLGFAAPLLYRVAREPQTYPPFHDVLRGGNLRYDAGPGWDYATGLGSPDVYNLARDLKKLLS